MDESGRPHPNHHYDDDEDEDDDDDDEDDEEVLVVVTTEVDIDMVTEAESGQHEGGGQHEGEGTWIEALLVHGARFNIKREEI